MNTNMGGEPTPEKKSVEGNVEETPHVNQYIERESKEKMGIAEQFKLGLEKWQANLNAKVKKLREDGEDEQTIDLFIEYSPGPAFNLSELGLSPVIEGDKEYTLELEKWQDELVLNISKMTLAGESSETINLFIQYSPMPEIKKEESVMEKEKREVETMLADFEKNHSLEYLNSIETLTPELLTLFKLDQKTETDQIETILATIPIEDSIKYKERISAINGLIPLVELLKKVYGKEFYEEESYRKLSRAVGILNSSGKVRHD